MSETPAPSVVLPVGTVALVTAAAFTATWLNVTVTVLRAAKLDAGQLSPV